MLFFKLLTCQITISHGINTLILVDRYRTHVPQWNLSSLDQVMYVPRHPIIRKRADIMLISHQVTHLREVSIEIHKLLISRKFVWVVVKIAPSVTSVLRQNDVTTLRGRQMAIILHMTFPNEVSWMEMIVFWMKYHKNCSPGSSLQACFGSDNSLAPNRWHVIIWTIDGQVHRHILTSLGSNELGNNEIWKAVVLPLISYPVYAPCT